MMDKEPEVLDVCMIAKQAGMILKEGLGKRHDVHMKGVQDPVTEIDKRSEDFIIKILNNEYPTHSILTEETGLHEGKTSDHKWYIDPLDGTMNYAHGIPFFCVSMAYADKKGLSLGVIYDPVRDECFYAERGKGAWLNGSPISCSSQTDLPEALMSSGFNMGIVKLGETNFRLFKYFMENSAGVRRMGSAALALAYAACGRLDAVWELHLSPWDVAAGFVICKEAGAIVTDLKGYEDYFNDPYEFVAANKFLHPIILHQIQTVGYKE